MFNSTKLNLSSKSIDTDTIELFSQDDIRLLRHENRSYSGLKVWNLSIFSVILLLIIGLSTFGLFRFSSSLRSPTIDEHYIEEFDNSSDFVFNYGRDHDKHNIRSKVDAGPQCLDIEPNDRLDCNPDDPIDKDVCLRRGCCWTPDQQLKPLHNISDNKSPLNVPFCYFSSDYVGYEVQSIETYAYRTVVTLNRKIGSGFLRDSQIVKLEVIEVNDYSVRYFINICHKMS